MAANPKELIERADSLKSLRATFDGHWDEVRRLMAATVAPFTGERTPGAKAHQEVLDNTGELASEMFAATLHSGLTSPSMRWFELRALDEAVNRDEDAARWLEAATETLYRVFQSPRGNFSAQIHEVYADLGDFGTGGLYVHDAPGEGVLFSARPLRELYLAESATGAIDTLFRRFRLTARQALQDYGERLSDEVRKAAASPKDADREFDFLHAIYPRREAAQGGRFDQRMAFASCHVEIGTAILLRESGHPEWPFMVPRWSKRSGEVYGRGPGMQALADCKMLQRVMRVTVRGAEKLIDPPLQVPDDGVVSTEIVTKPSAINVIRADLMTGQSGPIKPIDTHGQPALGHELMEEMRGRIQRAYHYDLIQVMRDPKMTATQVEYLARLVRQSLGPVLERLESELLNPMIRRVFGILWRTGGLPDLPDSLRGRRLQIEYVSPLAKAQRAGQGDAIARGYEMLAVVGAHDQSVVDNIDHDAAWRRAADLYGFPKDLQRPQRDVQRIRADRAEAQRAAAAMAELAQVAESGAKVAGALPKVAAMAGANG